jgi:NNP family nitrate/nitrite transporter-like MFS transporter
MEKSCPIPEPFSARAGAVFFIAALFFLNFMARFIFAPLLPFVEQELAITHVQAGSLFLVLSLGFSVAQFGSGFVSSHLTHRKALIVSAIAGGITLFVLGFMRSLAMLRITLLFLGFAAGLHIPSALATITAMVQSQDWGKAMGVHASAPTLGLVLGPLLVAALIGSVSWRGLIISLGVVFALAGVAFMVFGKGGDFPGDAPKPTPMKRIVHLPSFWLMIVLFIMALGGSVGIFTVLPLYLITERGFDNTYANTLLGFAQVSGFLAALAGGWFVDRFGPKWTMSVLLVAGGIATITLGVSSGPWLLAVVFIQPALTGAFFPGGFSALSRIAPPNLRSVLTSLAIPIAFFIGVGVFPAFYGYLGQTYSFGLGLALIGAFMLLGPVFAYSLRFVETDQEGC